MGIEDRMLVHWINSLPITECLIVENISDLRFGNIFMSIIQWLKNGCFNNDIDIHEKKYETHIMENKVSIVSRRNILFHVVQFVAMESCCQDGDALYIVNEQNCVIRAVQGEIEVLIAITKILRRLCNTVLHNRNRRNSIESIINSQMKWENYEPTDRVPDISVPILSPMKKKNIHVRKKITQKSEKLRVRSQKTQTNTLGTNTSINKNMTGVSNNCQSAQENLTLPTDSVITTNRKHLKHQRDGLQVYSMIDPTYKRTKWLLEKGSMKSDDTNSASMLNNQSYAQRQRLWQWIKSLGFDKLVNNTNRLQTEDSHANFVPSINAFNDGNFLYQLALALYRLKTSRVVAKGDKINSYGTLSDVIPLNFPTKNMLCGFSGRQYLSRALTLLKRAGVFDLSTETFWVCCGENENHDNEKHQIKDEKWLLSIWDLLQHIYDKVKETNLMPTNPESQHIQGNSTRENFQFPHITSEQEMFVVNHLHNLGIITKCEKESMSGMLNDTIRISMLVRYDGLHLHLQSLLISIICSAVTMNVYHKHILVAPRSTSITMARDNIVKAIEAVREINSSSVNFDHNCIPICYTTAHAIEKYISGDPHAIYGLLWHLLMICKDSQVMCIAELDEAETNPPRAQSVEPILPLKMHALLQDIPAIALVSTEYVNVIDLVLQQKVSPKKSVYVPWRESNSSNDDLYPVPSNAIQQVSEYKIARTCQSYENQEIQSTGYDSKEKSMDECATDFVSEESDILVPSKRNPSENDYSSEKSFASTHQGRKTKLECNQDIIAIVKWLANLKIELNHPEAMLDRKIDTLDDFRSGVLLCKLVGKLEVDNPIVGIDKSSKRPLARARALHNIGKALDILQQNKYMPKYLHRLKHDIYLGNRNTILELLSYLYKVYGCKNRRKKLYRSLISK